MKLQRWSVARGGLDTIDCLDDRGDWVRWADVLAWRDSIRAAVEVERGFTDTVLAAQLMMIKRPLAESVYRCDTKRLQARVALDALLADGGA